MTKMEAILDEVLELIFILQKLDSEIEETAKHGRKNMQRGMIKELHILARKIELQVERAIDGK